MCHVSKSFSVVCLALLPIMPALAQQASSEEQTVTQEQRTQIDAAKSVDELSSLARRFLMTSKTQAAAMCVEKMCAKDPKLLTDSQPVTSSKQWNEFWFTCRAQIREKSLAPNDAAGRVELARWLQKAGVIRAARATNESALRIKPDLPAAMQLAAELEPSLGLDFRYALTKPVLLTEYPDESVRVTAIRGNALLLAPLRYSPSDTRITLSPGSIKVTSDSGKHGRVMGLLLTEEPQKAEARTGVGARTGAAARTEAQPKTPAAAGVVLSDQPPDTFTNTFYERVQVEIKDGAPILLWQNTILSRSMESMGGTSGTLRPPTGRGAGGSRTPGATGGTYGSGGTPPRNPMADKRGEMPANGWLGLLVQYPEDATKVSIELPDLDPETIDLGLLTLIQGHQDGAGQPGASGESSSSDVMKKMAAYAADPSPPTAQLALAWLGKFLASRQAAAMQPQGDPLVTSTDLIFLSAMGHPDRRVRQAAFDGLVRTPNSLPEPILTAVREKASPQMLTGILSEAKVVLVAASAANKGDNPGMVATPTAPEFPPAVKKALEGMPVSTAPPNVYALLSACLGNRQVQAQQEALAILLTDATQQSMRVLADELQPEAVRTVIGQLSQLQNDQMKAAILRMRLIHPDPKMLVDVLKACGTLSVKVTSDDDPLLTALKDENLKGEPRQRLLELLARSDLTAVANSQTFATILTTVRAESELPAVHSALLALAISQFRVPYEAPIQRARSTGAAPDQQPGGSEVLLAELAMEPGVAEETAQKAAVALVASGRIAALKDQFLKSTDAARAQGILQALMRNRDLAKRESLATFLTGCLTNPDPKAMNPKVVQTILADLGAIDTAWAPENRWRLNLAIRQGINLEQLVQLTTNSEDRIAEQAMGLLRRVSPITSEQFHELELLSGESEARRDRLKLMIDRKTADPVGQYACLVCADIEMSVQADPLHPRAEQTSGGKVTYNNIPLASTKVVIERTSDNGLRILADRREIGKVAGTGGDTGGEHKPRAPGALSINAAPLVKAALQSDDARDARLSGKVDILSFDQPPEQKCDLAPDSFGGWSGELMINSPAQASPDRPARVVSAKIMLQPLNP